MEHMSIAIGCFALMLLLILLRVPIYIAMGTSSFIGLYLLGGKECVWQQFSMIPFYGTASYSWAVIPMFILMGVIAANCGLGENVYSALSQLLGSRRGALLHTTIWGSALLGACTGTPVAASAVFTRMVLPELKRAGYDVPLGLACIAAASTIAVLIPPSVPIVIVCMIAGLSVGRTLIAGIMPGILVGALLAVAVWLVSTLRPDLIPKPAVVSGSKVSLSAFVKILPVVFLFLLIIGGIYTGIFAPSLAGAIGSMGALLIALIVRAPVRAILRSFGEAVMLTGQVYPLLLTSYLFCRLVALSRLPEGLAALIADLHAPPFVVLVCVVVLLILLGCMMDLLPMLTIVVPIIFPLLTNLGFDPVVLAIILVLLCNIGGLTPPVGLGVYLVSVLAGESPSRVFRAMGPFLLAMLVALVLVLVFPQIVTWLPNRAFGV